VIASAAAAANEPDAQGHEAAAELAALKSQLQQTTARPTQHAHAQPTPTDAFITKSSVTVQQGACVHWQAAATPLAGMLRSSIQPIANGMLT
jgi:hypothetical protein